MSFPDRHGWRINRRRLLGFSGLAVASLPSGTLAALKESASVRSLPAVSQTFTDTLSIGYVEMGPADGQPVILLHGWPYDIHSFSEVAPILVEARLRVIIPYLRGFGTTRFRSEKTPRNAQQAMLATDVIALMDALRIDRAVIGGFDWGARSACIVAALWPERCSGLISVSGYLIGTQKAGQVPLAPKAELAWWYQYYFATERGRAGYAANCNDFNELIWRLASPRWAFDAETYARSAKSFDNPDHVAVVIHNYRWRLSLAEGDPGLQPLEDRLARSPDISVPTITMEGDANGAPHPEADAYRAQFTGPYEHRLIGGGIGHNLPQEAPEDFARAVLKIAGKA